MLFARCFLVVQGSDDDSEDEAGEGPAAMEGLRIRHKAEDLEDGDAVIMTLADRNILDERGELDEDEDVLEENLLVRHLSMRSFVWTLFYSVVVEHALHIYFD